jgi:hypothetical protein
MKEAVLKKIFVIIGLIAILGLAAPASAKTNKKAGGQAD